MNIENLQVRKDVIDGHPVYIVDNCLDGAHIDAYYKESMKVSFRKGETDFKGDQFPVFSYDFDPISFSSKYSIGKTADMLLAKLFPESDCTLFRSYINMIHYGDMEYPHRDCEIGKGNITFLYYVNNNWDYTWGGETKFYEDGEPRMAILPKPGRCVIFLGEVEHSAGVPTRICSSSRLTLALKYAVDKKNDPCLIL
ncbi:FlmC family 2OG-Fe(II) oxygenase [Chitinophaga tropicalis]|uniref:Prolyl 4-hydroxylase alpha subunit Fe(2+) 2OG dioxygenase domain-containing protein n=1 Tax=Chitinophaga tropicalis TaxID=2683588 RepID=A0A7K1UAM6_9BACT|nr:2OG-Fe(II) oxygenase [Chitinophaga tropicalis]MVT11432.1 hypothetical protein [Chitinophaga tropicalis]